MMEREQIVFALKAQDSRLGAGSEAGPAILKEGRGMQSV